MSLARRDPIVDVVADLELNLNKLELSVLLKYGQASIRQSIATTGDINVSSSQNRPKIR